MAGLLAAQMLRRYSPAVFEAQDSLPDNHGALLRFRSNIVAEATGIPLRRVEVQKALRRDTDPLLTQQLTLADANRYALKVIGEAIPRSILSLAPGERYVAHDDFLANLASGVQIHFRAPLTPEELQGRTPDSPPIISTIPMPVLMHMVGWSPAPTFAWRPIWTVRCRIIAPRVNLFQTIYYPGADDYYRASITGNQLIVEYMSEPSRTGAASDLADICDDFGFGSLDSEPYIVKRQEYGKLLPIPEDERKAFILAMSDQLAIYSLGRFATWRQILLDDVVKDVRHIETFLTQRSARYARRGHWSK